MLNTTIIENTSFSKILDKCIREFDCVKAVISHEKRVGFFGKLVEEKVSAHFLTADNIAVGYYNYSMGDFRTIENKVDLSKWVATMSNHDDYIINTYSEEFIERIKNEL